MTTYTNTERTEGITKARLVANITLAKSGQPLHVDDDAYVAFVCTSASLATLPETAAESYFEQHAGKTVEELEQELVDAATATPTYEPNIVPTVAGVPQSVTMRQARLALAATELLATVNAVVAQADEATQIEWEFAATVDRGWPTLIALQGALGLTDAQIDDLFVLAATL